MICCNGWGVFSMKNTIKPGKQQKLVNVGDCLYRSDSTHTYYGIFDRDGRQVKRSLRTTDRELAKRKLEELRRKVDRLTRDDAKTLPFTEYRRDEKTGAMTSDLIGGLAKGWFDAAAVSVKPKTIIMYLTLGHEPRAERFTFG